jgi:hypothetical protein
MNDEIKMCELCLEPFHDTLHCPLNVTKDMKEIINNHPIIDIFDRRRVISDRIMKLMDDMLKEFTENNFLEHKGITILITNFKFVINKNNLIDYIFSICSEFNKFYIDYLFSTSKNEPGYVRMIVHQNLPLITLDHLLNSNKFIENLGEDVKYSSDNKVLVISHKWFGKDNPDPENRDYNDAIKTMVEGKYTHCFYDYSCLPQTHPNDDSKIRFKYLLKLVDFLYMNHKVLILNNYGGYQNSYWCVAEFLISPDKINDSDIMFQKTLTWYSQTITDARHGYLDNDKYFKRDLSIFINKLMKLNCTNKNDEVLIIWFLIKNLCISYLWIDSEFM